jgi:regulator of sigma E protease
VIGVPSTSTRIDQITPGSAAARSELAVGDRVGSIAGRSVNNFSELRLVVLLRPGQRVPLEYERSGQVRRTFITIGSEERVDEFGQKARLGHLGVGTMPARPSPWQVVPEATRYTFALTRSMIDGLGQIISGQRSTKDLGGPLKMAQIAGQQASLGAFEFIQLIALFSINLGFINLLPVPMLDGGHLVFYAAEAVRRRPVSIRAQDWAFRGGLALLLALLVFTTVNDLASFGLFERLGRLIG